MFSKIGLNRFSVANEAKHQASYPTHVVLCPSFFLLQLAKKR